MKVGPLTRALSFKGVTDYADHDRQNSRIVWSLIAVGGALRAWQFIGGASLGIDESNLATNIAERSYGELVKQLDNGQVAPPGFLLAERLIWSMFHSDWSVQLLPFAAAVTSLFLFRALVRRTLHGMGISLAMGAFSLGVPFIMYGSWVKQYSTDVAVAIGLLLLTANIVERAEISVKHYTLAGLAGLFAVWFSNAAVFVVGGIGAALCLLAITGSLAEKRNSVMLMLIPWVAAAIGAVTFGMHSVAPETMAFMKEFWRGGLAPRPPWTVFDLAWPWRVLRNVFGDGQHALALGYRFGSFYLLLALLGIVVLWRTRRTMALILICPVVVTFGAAVAQAYPFDGRLILFLTPTFLIAASAGAAATAEWLGSNNRIVESAFTLLVVIPPVEHIVVGHPVYRMEEARPLFKWLAAHRNPNSDLVFVFVNARPHVRWYGLQYGLNGEVMVGGCWRDEPRRFLHDLDRVRGHSRVWLVSLDGSDSAEMMIRYANMIGVRREGHIVPGSRTFETWLYDFSDPSLLRRTSAEAFQIGVLPKTRCALGAADTAPGVLSR